MVAPEIEVVMHSAAWEGRVHDLESVCRSAGETAWRAAGEPAVAGAVAVALADDAEIADLNWRYRARAGATNVLSFAYDCDPAEGPDGPEPPLGDIIVAYETAAAEAAAEARPLADHLGRLVIHGMLHLLGYDHATSDDAAKMEALEARALAALGVTDPEAPLLTASHEPNDIR